MENPLAIAGVEVADAPANAPPVTLGWSATPARATDPPSEQDESAAFDDGGGVNQRAAEKALSTEEDYMVEYERLCQRKHKGRLSDDAFEQRQQELLALWCSNLVSLPKGDLSKFQGLTLRDVVFMTEKDVDDLKLRGKFKSRFLEGQSKLRQVMEDKAFQHWASAEPKPSEQHANTEPCICREDRNGHTHRLFTEPVKNRPRCFFPDTQFVRPVVEINRCLTGIASPEAPVNMELRALNLFSNDEVPLKTKEQKAGKIFHGGGQNHQGGVKQYIEDQVLQLTEERKRASRLTVTCRVQEEELHISIKVFPPIGISVHTCRQELDNYENRTGLDQTLLDIAKAGGEEGGQEGRGAEAGGEEGGQEGGNISIGMPGAQAWIPAGEPVKAAELGKGARLYGPGGQEVTVTENKLHPLTHFPLSVMLKLDGLKEMLAVSADHPIQCSNGGECFAYQVALAMDPRRRDISHLEHFSLLSHDGSKETPHQIVRAQFWICDVVLREVHFDPPDGTAWVVLDGNNTEGLKMVAVKGEPGIEEQGEAPAAREPEQGEEEDDEHDAPRQPRFARGKNAAAKERKAAEAKATADAAERS